MDMETIPKKTPQREVIATATDESPAVASDSGSPLKVAIPQTTQTDNKPLAMVVSPPAKDAITAPMKNVSLKEVHEAKEEIYEQAKALVAELNAKRKHDAKLLEDFKKALDSEANKQYEIVEQALYGLYARQSEIVQRRLNDLYATLDEMCKLETEVHEFNRCFEIFCSQVSAAEKQ